MKFFYNGKLIRTSRSHEYKYAAITANGNCLCCSSTLDGCVKLLEQKTANGKGWLRNYEQVYNGTFVEKKGGWEVKDIMGMFNDSLDELKNEIDRLKAYYDGIKIVELEMKK